MKGFEGYFYPIGLTRRGRPTFKILRGAHSGGGVIPKQHSPIQCGFTTFPGKRLLRFGSGPTVPDQPYRFVMAPAVRFSRSASICGLISYIDF